MIASTAACAVLPPRQYQMGARDMAGTLLNKPPARSGGVLFASTEDHATFKDVVRLVRGLVVFNAHDAMQRCEMRIRELLFSSLFFEGFPFPPHPLLSLIHI